MKQSPGAPEERPRRRRRRMGRDEERRTIARDAVRLRPHGHVVAVAARQRTIGPGPGACKNAYRLAIIQSLAVFRRARIYGTRII